MKGAHKRKSEWCPMCDRVYLPIGVRCDCGYKNKSKLPKKTTKQLLNASCEDINDYER